MASLFRLALGAKQAPPKRGSSAHVGHIPELDKRKFSAICPGQQSASRSAPSLVHIRELEDVFVVDNKHRTLMEVICCSSES